MSSPYRTGYRQAKLTSYVLRPAPVLEEQEEEESVVIDSVEEERQARDLGE